MRVRMKKKLENGYNMGPLIIINNILLDIIRVFFFLQLNISCSDISVQTQVSSSKKNRKKNTLASIAPHAKEISSEAWEPNIIWKEI